MPLRYQQLLLEPHMNLVMKFVGVLLTLVTVVNAGFIPPIQERGFMPITHRWQTSLEESGDMDHFEPEHHQYAFGDNSPDLHLHEDHGHYHHEHFEDSEEYHPTFETHSLPEEPEIKQEKIVHVHEHHHHYHSHYKTLPISIIKKTVYIKHG